MGSGSKFRFFQAFDYFAVGITASRFPHAVSLTFDLGFWHIYIGFGKGYDEQ